MVTLATKWDKGLNQYEGSRRDNDKKHKTEDRNRICLRIAALGEGRAMDNVVTDQSKSLEFHVASRLLCRD